MTKRIDLDNPRYTGTFGGIALLGAMDDLYCYLLDEVNEDWAKAHPWFIEANIRLFALTEEDYFAHKAGEAASEADSLEAAEGGWERYYSDEAERIHGDF